MPRLPGKPEALAERAGELDELKALADRDAL
jgi:hypothetical protein